MAALLLVSLFMPWRAESGTTSFDLGTGEPPVIFTYTLANPGATPELSNAADMPLLFTAQTSPLPEDETTTVPEPSSLLLVGLGVIGLAGIALRRRT